MAMLSKARSTTQRRRSSARNVKVDEVPNRPVKEVPSELRNSQPRTSPVPKSQWRKSLQTSSNRSLLQRPPERMGHRPSTSSEATLARLKEVVLSTPSRPSRPHSPPPHLHQLSPDISFIHRHEVATHQAAIRSGRPSPVLSHQARGSNPIDVIGYTFHPGRRDSSSTALYSNSTIPGEYIPPSPREVPSPARVMSPFRREAIRLDSVARPVLVPRLDQPPFVPALPEGTVVRPLREWGRSTSAPESWESVLRHSAVYRAWQEDYSPRVPSPLHEQHGPDSFRTGESEEDNWSHGTTPLDGVGLVNGVTKEPRMRGGGEDYFSLPVRREARFDQHWYGWDHDCETHPEEAPHSERYPLPEGYNLATCMNPTSEIPHLRGGGNQSREPKRIPASLFYLAGATGRKPEETITVDAWNKMKPKKRMGGLLGMAVFGNKGGKPYNPEKRDQEVQTEPEPEHQPQPQPAVSVQVDVAAGNQ
ncbi:uncharacterized protein N0V89_004674 [Didymosphaeria variabile]|uniref:Uncharacterized protein n=1 Tax=Didymosphaeria variabile TaxID=1932322 RepID=A0A9W8XPV6_9PLEO|nr:uncharacterized protein N0V89_004674 [Didymosphaeria variabile]KAJ4356638.1 hypothetical protein N0V89_004674 [Didymosphaeria variabile]